MSKYMSRLNALCEFLHVLPMEVEKIDGKLFRYDNRLYVVLSAQEAEPDVLDDKDNTPYIIYDNKTYYIIKS